MAFRPGVSGNPKGRPRKLLKRPDEVLNERNINPIEEILRELEQIETPQARVKVWLELLPYVAAKQKEVMVDERGSPLSQLTDDELIKLVRGEPKKLEAG